MAVHVFTVSEENYKICVERGIVALPESTKEDISDGLLSRLSGIKENDYVLMYILKPAKLLCGVWQVDGCPFYEDSVIWNDTKTYPFRCRIKWSEFNFYNALKLDDINDLRNSGKIWTWALTRASGSNSMFSISNEEFNVLLNEFVKINPFTQDKAFIRRPYPYHDNNIVNNLHFKNSNPKFESTIMALLSSELAKGSYGNIFGNYSDHLCYVPTNLGKEIDIMLMYYSPLAIFHVASYDIIEVKRDEFTEEALRQLIGYESWFLQKKVGGDMNMVRTTAIAKSFSSDVIQYVNQRKRIEGKPIKLLKYEYKDEHLLLEDILDT